MSESGWGDPDEGPAQKVSVSMPASRIAAVRARAGARGFSAYVSAAVERQLQRDLLEELLAKSEAEAGPIPQEMIDRAVRAFRTAEELAGRECGGPDPEHESTSGEGDVWHGRRAG